MCARAFYAPLLIVLVGCAERQSGSVVEFEESRFRHWSGAEVEKYFGTRWFISINEAPGPPWSEEPDSFDADAMGTLKSVVLECGLGATVVSHGYHGVANLYIEELPLTPQKVACIRTFEKRGVSLHEPA